jgi:hypothetical protein
MITVSHKKRQQPVSAKPEGQFDFEWHLCMTFAPQAVTMNDSTLSISQLEFTEATSSAKQEEVKKMFQDLLEKDVLPVQ